MIRHPKLSVAPMMDWTDRHCRYFHRLLSPNAMLYTEMVTTGAILHGEANRFLNFQRAEHPITLQLGGSDPDQLAACALQAQHAGFDEVNINVGCPSDRVQNGMIGACLMDHPQLVADCVSQMKEKVDIPITVKTRIGIDDKASYDFLAAFIETVSNAGCDHFIVHARKAILKGLSPKENRSIPPINHPRVYQIKQAFPHLQITVNGEIKTLEQVNQHLGYVDGVMLGREVYQNPYLLNELDHALYGTPVVSREQVLSKMIDYADENRQQGVKLHHITRHMLGLFSGQPGGKHWRRHLSENTRHASSGVEVLQQAYEAMQVYRQDESPSQRRTQVY